MSKAMNTEAAPSVPGTGFPPISTHPAALLTEEQAAALLSVSMRTLQGWRTRGGGPKFVSISKRAVRYRVADLMAWIDDRTATSTSDPRSASSR